MARTRSLHKILGLCAAPALLSAAAPAGAQTWTRLIHNPPAPISLMLLLPDGSVMAARNNGSNTIYNGWYRLRPDAQGNYANGTWTTLASMHDTRLYYSSVVLRDGRVFVAGGEYGTGGARAEVYDPTTNVWTQVNPPTTLMNPGASSPVTGLGQSFYDSNCEILANGNVLIMPVNPMTAGVPLIYNPTTNTWANGPRLFRGDYQDESSWAKLPDGTILTIDPFGTNSERFNPAANSWINDSTVPVSLYDPYGYETGAAFLLPTGHAFYLGSTGHTALYAPSGTAAPGVWSAGPDIPGGHGTPDAPAAMMVTGNVLCAVSPIPTSANHFPTPTTFYEYNPFTNTFTSVGAPVGSSDNIPTYKGAMLDLPDGTVLYSHMGLDVYAYRPAGAPFDAGKPIVQSVTQNADGSYHVTGLQLNGISEGAAYGDDLQMNSNYPLVRLTEAGGNVYYARTFNWSSTGVMTGSQVVSVEFALPAGLPAGSYTAQVVANGIASDPFNPFCTQPSVDTDPTPQTLCAGGQATFSVSASGSDTLTFEWKRGDTVIVNGPNASGADTSTLVINPVTDADRGLYTCTITNACGSAVSNAAALTVNSADFNGDGDLGTDADIADFFACLAGSCCPTCGSADFNADNDVGTDADIEAFFTVLAGGSC